MPLPSFTEEAMVSGLDLNWGGFFTACKIVETAEMKAKNKSLHDLVVLAKARNRAIHYIQEFRTLFEPFFDFDNMNSDDSLIAVIFDSEID